jgi:anti-sigma B factor antagonist
MSRLRIDAEVPTASLDGGADVVVLVASGEIDYDSCPLLRTAILSHVGAGKRRLVIDLSDVGFIDSMAIGVLVGTVARLRASGGGSLVVVCAQENTRVLRIFDISGVASVISLHHSREEALRALVAAWMMELPAATQSEVAGVLGDEQPEPPRRSRLGAAQRYAQDAFGGADCPGRCSVPAGLGYGFDELA